MNEHDMHIIAQRIAGRPYKVRTAGRIEFVRDQGPIRRDVRVKDFEWRPDTLRGLTKILWAAERSHGYGIAALRLFSKMPSSEFSPDGLLGGRGYIQQVREMRSSLSQAVEALSAFTDTIHDEIGAPHWASVGEDLVADGMIEGAQEVNSDPVGFVEGQFRQEVGEQTGVQEPFSNPSPDDYNPSLENQWDWDWDEGGDGDEGGPRLSSTGFGPAFRRLLDGHKPREASVPRRGDSSLPVETLPGPRVLHIGPGESPEEFGYFTDQGERPSDDLLGEGFSQLDRIVEGPDTGDVTGYDNPTDGDESVFKSASALARSGGTYSWLPGADNRKSMNYYERGLTEADTEWMRAHSDPDPPPGSRKIPFKPAVDPLWESRTGG